MSNFTTELIKNLSNNVSVEEFFAQNSKKLSTNSSKQSWPAF